MAISFRVFVDTEEGKESLLNDKAIQVLVKLLQNPDINHRVELRVTLTVPQIL